MWFLLNCRFFIDGLAMSNFYTNTADNRKPSVSSNSDESNRINKEPSSSSCSLLNTTNFEFIDADINSGSNGVSKLADGTNCTSKTGCAGYDESPVSKIGNYFSFFDFNRLYILHPYFHAIKWTKSSRFVQKF